MNYQQAQVRAEMLKALGHPTRILIVDALMQGDLCVCELNKLAPVVQSNMSRHLETLRKAGIVVGRRQGMKVIYHLVTPCILKAFDCAIEAVRLAADRRSKRLKAALT